MSRGTPTPSPWRACGCGKCGLIWSVPADVCLAVVTGHCDEQGVTFSDEERQANCRLIAAAPELLEALEMYLQAGHKEARHKASLKAKAAIVRVRGES